MTAAPEGLTAAAAAARLAEAGPNQIRRDAPSRWWRTLLGQFLTPMVGILLAACAIAAALGDVVDTVAIGAIVVINGLVGFFQEFRAEKAVMALRSLAAPRARVRRDGRALVVAAADVVPGDVLLLEAGDVVAADARVAVAYALRTNEAALTGESQPVEKRADAARGGAMAERAGDVFAGTAVVSGTGEAVVGATGMQTELGKIALLLSTAQQEATPLEARLRQVTRTLLWVCLGAVAVVAGLGLWRGEPAMGLLMSAVSLAVAAVPEGLPAIVTVALSIGVQRMARRQVLVRHLPAVEALGCTTVICTDKTGTLTTGVMTVRTVWGPDPARTLEAAAACCDAELGPPAVGDPTEIALLAAAAARGVHRDALERDRPRVHVQPFDSERKRMSIWRGDGRLYVKGAFESVAPRCTAGLAGAADASADLAAHGLRVLAVATGPEREEAGLTLLGLVGLADPPRPEAIAALADARRAGIETVMITGDHPVTAAAIAREMGLLREEEPLTGHVHARATPEEKLQIVRGWKQRGAVVAMTGDGVNDAPALREAHVGIAMGVGGTEVTREAADVVLLDDNFASIVAGIREGRGIFENIRKTVVYLLGGNLTELVVMIAAGLAGVPLPLLPLHLLWINLVTETLPALALVIDPTAPDAMAHPPRRVDEPMLGRPQWWAIGRAAALQATAVFGVYLWALQTAGVDAARGLAFTTLVFADLCRAFSARSPTRIFWETGAFSNLVLLGVVGVAASLQLGLHTLPFTQGLFALRPLEVTQLLVAAGAALAPTTLIELSKLARRWRQRAG